VSQVLLDNPNRVGALGGASFFLALLLSLCTAVFPISGIRLAIGLMALASVSVIHGPAWKFCPESSALDLISGVEGINSVVRAEDLYICPHAR